MDDTPKEILKAQKLLAERFPNYIILAEDGDQERYEKWSNDHWAEGICRRTAIEIESSWQDIDDDLSDEEVED